MEWGKIFVNDATNKGSISNIYKQLIQLKSKKPKQSQLKNGQKALRHFSKEDRQMPNSVQRYSRSLIFREKQIETTVRYHLTPARVATT